MSIKERLKQFGYLKKEIVMGKRKLKHLSLLLEAKTDSYMGLSFPMYQNAERYPVELYRLYEQIDKNYKKCMAELEWIERFIDKIDESFMRQIISYRYMEQCSWTSIAIKMGGGNTPDGVRKAAERFLKGFADAHKIA